MSRLVAYRSKATEAIKQRMEETLAATMYLVQTTGPTSYVIQEQNSEKKHKVLIGALQTCSCGELDVCIHVLFVMLKVLRVPATTPIVWQKSLIDSEVEALLRGDYREHSRPPPRPIHTSFKRRKDAKGGAEPETNNELAEAERHALVPGEVCAICQEDMLDDQPLTYCHKGCGNNFHIECMKVFGESRKQSKENIICPLCRHDWGDLALTALKKEIDVANRAPNVHKGVGCKKCQTKPIRNERYRCVQCKNTDLCDRCFKMNAHINHAFVMKKMVADTWTPALRSHQKRQAIGSDLVEELQNRELTTNDYDLLLQLDQREKYPIQDYLLSVLGGQRVLAANVKSFGDPNALCTLCRQSLRIQADVRSILCGHAFHESCLARSILAQSFVCPFPGCDHVMFPGMHNLVKAKKLDKDEGHAHDPAQESSALAQLDIAFSVTSLRSTVTHSSSQDHRDGKIRARKPQNQQVNNGKEASSNEASDLGLRSVQLMPTHPQTLPALHRPVRSSTQDPETTRSSSSAESRRAKPLLPHVHPIKQPTRLDSRESEIDSRLQHAQDSRDEKKKLDKERMIKQRQQREDRVRQNQSNNETNHSALNVFLPRIGTSDTSSSLEERQTKAHENRTHNQQRLREGMQSKRKARDELAQREVRAQPALDLFIGAVRPRDEVSR